MGLGKIAAFGMGIQLGSLYHLSSIPRPELPL